MNTPSWVNEKQASETLGLAISTLRMMRRVRRLQPGKHWIYATGNLNGPVHYCLNAVREMQRKETVAAVRAEDERRKAQLKERTEAIETYGEPPHLDDLIAEVQS